MLATTASVLPIGPGWSFEMKWDGIRALFVVERGVLKVFSRTGRDVTVRYPELAGLADALAAHDATLDGEIVVLDDGRPSFEALQRHERPAAALLFDVLALDGESLIDLEQTARRARLELLRLNGSNWQTPPTWADGPAAFETATRLGLEGVVAKRLDARYLPGRRSPAWRKVKIDQTQEFVVGGWLPGANRLEGRLGSLLVGVYDDEARLQYSGRVGSGISEATRAHLEALLADRAAPEAPFADPPQLRDVVWARPELVVEVRFTEWTGAGLLRHPRFRGLRDDKDPSNVVREETQQILRR
jgi:bifunctional non-homologous end joining protein LigD